jgi:hypothetical protein
MAGKVVGAEVGFGFGDDQRALLTAAPPDQCLAEQLSGNQVGGSIEEGRGSGGKARFSGGALLAMAWIEAGSCRCSACAVALRIDMGELGAE